MSKLFSLPFQVPSWIIAKVLAQTPNKNSAEFSWWFLLPCLDKSCKTMGFESVVNWFLLSFYAMPLPSLILFMTHTSTILCFEKVQTYFSHCFVGMTPVARWNVQMNNWKKPSMNCFLEILRKFQYIKSCLEVVWGPEVSSYTKLLPVTWSPVNILHLSRQVILSLGSKDQVSRKILSWVKTRSPVVFYQGWRPCL